MRDHWVPIIFGIVIVSVLAFLIIEKENEREKEKEIAQENIKKSAFKKDDIVEMADGVKFRIYNINQFGTHLQNLQTGAILESINESTIRKWTPPTEKQ